MGTLLGWAVSREALIYSEVFTLAVLMAIMTNVCQYFYFHPPRAKPGSMLHVRPWLPFALLSAATFFLLLSPLKNLVVNVCMASFRANGYDSTIGQALDFFYRPMWRDRPLKFYTALGYTLMMAGTVLQVDLGGKLAATFKRVPRGGALKGASPEACGPAG